MRVQRLRTLGFRNLARTDLALGPGITLLSGPNGAGKTNLLEALYLALAGRSPRTKTDREAIRFGEPLARVEVQVAEDEDAPGGDSRTFLCALERGGDRRHQLDGHAVGPDASEQRPPLSVFMPDRLVLVKGPPAARRAHLDRFTAALWPARADARRRYGRALAQRNALLGRIRSGISRPESLDAWESEMSEAGAELMRVRAHAAGSLAPAFAEAARELGLTGEAELEYRPRCEAEKPSELATELALRRDADLERGFTTHGPHLDELALRREDRALRRYGSQGEQRLALLALLFAEREVLLAEGRHPPLMLLDDVTSELDADRRKALCERLLAGGGQTVITATEAEQLPAECPRKEVALRAGAVIAPAEDAPAVIEAA